LASAAEHATQHGASERFGEGLAALLEPLTELSSHYGMEPHEIRAALNRALLRSTSSRIRRTEGREPTPSRLAVYCGLTAGEVNRLLRAEVEAQRLEKLVVQVMSVLTRWHTDSNFSSLYGVPFELNLDADESPNFQELLRAAACDSPASEILAELFNGQCVERLPSKKIRATNRTYKLKSGTNATIRRLSEMIRAYNDTWVQNIVRSGVGEPSFLELDVHTDHAISPKSFADVSRVAGSKLTAVIEEIDSSLNQSKGVPDPDGVNGGIGVFFFADRRTLSPNNIQGLSAVTSRIGN
jgi:hypothetical protein